MLDVISSLPLKSVGSDWEGGVLVHVHMIILLVECGAGGVSPECSDLATNDRELLTA